TDLNEVVSVGLNELADKIERIYLENEKVSSSDSAYLLDKLESIQTLPVSNSKEVREVANEMNELAQKADNWLLEPASNRFVESLDYLEEILNVRAERLALDEEADG